MWSENLIKFTFIPKSVGHVSKVAVKKSDGHLLPINKGAARGCLLKALALAANAPSSGSSGHR